jgi:hypothetical protein
MAMPRNSAQVKHVPWHRDKSEGKYSGEKFMLGNFAAPASTCRFFLWLLVQREGGKYMKMGSQLFYRDLLSADSPVPGAGNKVLLP